MTAPGDNGATADTYLCNAAYPAIGYTTNGNFTLQLQNNVSTATGGLVVSATGADTVFVSRPGDSPVNSGDPSLTSTSGAGLQVTRAVGSTGGAITIFLSDPFGDAADTPLAISGTSAGVRLVNAGSATTAFTTNGGTISASSGAGIDVSSAGTGSITITNGSTVSASTYGIYAATNGTGNVTINNTGTVTGPSGAIRVASGDNATITHGAGKDLNGTITLNNTGTSIINNTGVWNTVGTNFLGDGATTLTINTVGRLRTNEDGAGTTLDFGMGANTLRNFGQLIVGTGSDAASTLTLLGVPVWSNSGTVLFGFDPVTGLSDGAANDRVVSTGTVFTGSVTPEVPGGTAFSFSQLIMDVDFSADQDSCAGTISADCLDLRGSSTAGATDIVVNVAGSGPAERIVLVDVGGAGSSAAGHFILSEASTNFLAIGDAGVVESGFFLYELQYDAGAQQHVLAVAAAGGRSLEIARLARATSEPWRTATGMWHDRQADLRYSLLDGGYAPGAWLKVAGNSVDDKRFDVLTLSGAGADYNTGYDQETTAIVGGIDVIRILREDSAWVFGLTAGKADSTMDFTVAETVVEMEGSSFGAYASMLAGPLFVDAIVNSTNLDLTYGGFGSEFEGSAKSLGYQVEGGYRLFQIGEDGAWLEPLAALTYVKTEVDDLDMDDVTTDFDDATSLRAAVGLRLGGNVVTDALTVSLSATGRFWKELDGESTGVMSASFGDTALVDEAMDNLGDVGVAVSLFTLGGRLSGHLAYNALFRDDYLNTGASIGLRFNW